MKILRQSKKNVFECLKLIMQRYDKNLIYALQDKDKAIDLTLHYYHDYFEWLQKLDRKPKKIVPKKVYVCVVCNSELQNGICINKECVTNNPRI